MAKIEINHDNEHACAAGRKLANAHYYERFGMIRRSRENNVTRIEGDKKILDEIEKKSLTAYR